MDQVESLLQTMLSANPRLASFAPVLDVMVKSPDSESKKLCAYGFAVVRWRFDCGTPAPLQ